MKNICLLAIFSFYIIILVQLDTEGRIDKTEPEELQWQYDLRGDRAEAGGSPEPQEEWSGA